MPLLPVAKEAPMSAKLQARIDYLFALGRGYEAQGLVVQADACFNEAFILAEAAEAEAE
jgi:hypothetical protein